jgi:hypothetical protein
LIENIGHTTNGSTAIDRRSRLVGSTVLHLPGYARWIEVKDSLGVLCDNVRLWKNHLPAAGHDWLLPLYDPLVKLLGGDTARRTLLEQATIQPGHRVLDIGSGTGGAGHVDQATSSRCSRRRTRVARLRAFGIRPLVPLLVGGFRRVHPDINKEPFSRIVFSRRRRNRNHFSRLPRLHRELCATAAETFPQTQAQNLLQWVFRSIYEDQRMLYREGFQI